MKTVTLLLFTILFHAGDAQEPVCLPDYNLADSAQISAERLNGDSLSTSFIISVQSHVPKHYHANHTEHVYIIGGSGRFLLNSDTFDVKRGDYLFIPKKSIHEVWVDEGEPMRVLSIQSPEFLGDDRIPVE